MSRGLGQLQRSICIYLAANPAQATYETLRWELFEQRKKAAIPSPDDTPARLRDGRLPGTWNSSLKRALDGLAEHGERRVIIDRRHLASMEEFVRHYPGKSLVASTRELRLVLLPALAAIVEAKKHLPRYTQVENETFYLNYLKEYLGYNLRPFQNTWSEIEPELVKELQSVAGDNRSTLFLLVARAKSLFEGAPLECRRSIAECVQPLVEHGALSPALEKKITAFSASLVPPSQIGFLRLKSYIRSFSDIPSRGSSYRLKPETLASLEDACPEVMKTLPGYQPPPAKKSGMWALDDGPRSTYGPEIHKLIDKTVFETFVFIRKA